jgi:hypothetical protein
MEHWIHRRNYFRSCKSWPVSLGELSVAEAFSIKIHG